MKPQPARQSPLCRPVRCFVCRPTCA